jgi:hypothetical protein
LLFYFVSSALAASTLEPRLHTSLASNFER